MAGRHSARTRCRRRTGLQASSGATAAGAQVSTVAPPSRDVRARSQRPHQRARPSAERSPAHVPADGQRRRAPNRAGRRGESSVLQRQAVGGLDALALPQGSQRILLEPRGSRRLSSQTLLDLRVSKTVRFGGAGRDRVAARRAQRVERHGGRRPGDRQPVRLHVRTAERSFVDPRRAMFSARLNLGR